MLPVETFKMPLQAVQTTYPIKLRKGKNYVMTLPLERKDGKEMKLFFQGKDIKLTIINNHRVISRLVLPNGSFPDVRGGSRDTEMCIRDRLRPGLLLCEAHAAGGV